MGGIGRTMQTPEARVLSHRITERRPRKPIALACTPVGGGGITAVLE